MKKEELIPLVIEEATNLRKYFTGKEKRNLDISWLDADYGDTCIYGQATGNCFSPRAHVLINKCAAKVILNESLSIKGAILNGKPDFGKDTRKGDYWSPIEIFITINDDSTLDNGNALINYIKGKTETLELK